MLKSNNNYNKSVKLDKILYFAAKENEEEFFEIIV